MRRIEDQRTGRWAGVGTADRTLAGPGRAGRRDAGNGASPAAPAPPPPAGGDHRLVHPPRTRWLVTAGAGAVLTGIVALSFLFSGSDADMLLIHAIATAPFTAAGLPLTRRAEREGPPEYAPFWRRWFVALLLATLASAAAAAGVVFDSRLLVAVDMLLILVSIPFWVSATLIMVKAQAGKRDMAVDVVDTAMAVAVLTAPGVLLVVEPIQSTDRLIFAVPFAITILFAPAYVYLSVVNLERIPRGERVPQAMGLVMAACVTVGLTLHLARALGDTDVPVPVFVSLHGTAMTLAMLIPLWAHRHTTGRLAHLGPDQQFRLSNPMPYVSAALLPPLAVWVALTRDERPWSVAYLGVVLLTVIVLNAVRYTLMTRETRRLGAELSCMAEERRRLLASMVRALEHDRHRTVAELHTQAVGSLATLASIVQAAYVTLPGDTALAVRETIAQLQGDLTDRAEELRRLMVAMRPPAFPASGDDSALATALLAYADDLGRDPSGPRVDVHVDPALELDRSTMTIVYRIAQEALLNASRHALASAVAVEVSEQDGNVVVEVRDDGVGFDLEGVTGGSGLASMQLFTNLGRGELTVHTTPGQGTVVRSVLGVRPDGEPSAGAPRTGAAAGRPRLRLIPTGPED